MTPSFSSPLLEGVKQVVRLGHFRVHSIYINKKKSISSILNARLRLKKTSIPLKVVQRSDDEYMAISFCVGSFFGSLSKFSQPTGFIKRIWHTLRSDDNLEFFFFEIIIRGGEGIKKNVTQPTDQ